MAEYKESTTQGTKWQRSYKVIVNNSVDGLPHLIIYEETCLSDGETFYRNPIPGSIHLEFDKDRVFSLKSPIDDSDLGATSTHGELQVLLYSAVRDAQLKRDEQEALINDPSS